MAQRNPREIIDRLFSRTRHGIKLGIDRMLAASDEAGNPQNAYSSIHVAGTNGKGSVCAYMESVIRSTGFKTGLFTSPHIVNFEERFIINGNQVPTLKWLEVYCDVENIIEKYNLTFFEAITLIAFELFKREKVEWAIFETGMGGRLDATNIIVPRVSVISVIEMDHTEYLGKDLPSIAREKLGIVKKNVPLVMLKPPQSAIESLAIKRCDEMSAPCFMVSEDRDGAYATNGNSTNFLYKGKKFTTTLNGRFQVKNAIVAIKALECAGFNDSASMADGIASTILPGRFQILELLNRIVVFDVGHNPNAAEAMADALKIRFDGLPMCFVTGIMKDKDIAGILSHYCGMATRL
ncbi:MAG TPA: hypothetical protein DCO75_04860, partial [Fibrobacteres bacterium]|nr:hypothetical protein [Fibrobacterota bacterium]